MKYTPEDKSSIDEQHLELIREFMDSSFDNVERDGIMVSRGGGRIWVHESHGITVPDDARDISNHQYQLIWSAPAESVFDELERRFGWSV